MSKPYAGRWCIRFHCDRRGDRYCCADCPVKRKCRNPCQNDPARCGLENKQSR